MGVFSLLPDAIVAAVAHYRNSIERYAQKNPARTLWFGRAVR
jgi:hypothetical protein